MRLQLMGGIALAAVAAICASARADVHTFARQGAWEAAGGTSTSGQPMCALSSSGADKYFGLKYFKGDATLTIQLSAKDWRITDGAKQRVTMQIDQNASWNAVATGMHFADGDAGLEFAISATQLGQFMEQFRDGDAILLWFPNSDVADWRGTLDGTDTISNGFIGCIRAL